MTLIHRVTEMLVLGHDELPHPDQAGPGKISFLNELSCSEGKLGLVEVEQALEVDEDSLDCFRSEKSFNRLTPTRPENIKLN